MKRSKELRAKLRIKRERERLVRDVKAGEAEHRAGKTKVLRSLRDLR
jgi:hypothetical protein